MYLWIYIYTCIYIIWIHIYMQVYICICTHANILWWDNKICYTWNLICVRLQVRSVRDGSEQSNDLSWTCRRGALKGNSRRIWFELRVNTQNTKWKQTTTNIYSDQEERTTNGNPRYIYSDVDCVEKNVNYILKTTSINTDLQERSKTNMLMSLCLEWLAWYLFGWWIH